MFMKILAPSKNSQTGDPTSHGYKAYDFSGKGDQNVYTVFFGKVVQAKNSETRSWIVGKSSDPYLQTRGKKGDTWKLLTEDYGNYCKIKHQVDGKVFYTLYAHLDVGSVLPVGSEVRKGQVIAQIDHTGNSNAKHLHFEIRDENNKNFEVEFVDEEEVPKPTMEDKRQVIIDLYKACTGEYPSDDEISLRLQQNKNRVELIEDLLKNDGRSKVHWMSEWGISGHIDYKETVDNYKTSFGELKDLLKLKEDADTEEVRGAVVALLNTNAELKKVSTPQTIYKLDGKEFEKVFALQNFALIIEKLQIGG